MQQQLETEQRVAEQCNDLAGICIYIRKIILRMRKGEGKWRKRFWRMRGKGKGILIKKLERERERKRNCRKIYYYCL